MRVALCPSAFAPQVGGVEVVTESLAQTLQESGRDVEVWTARTREDDLPEQELLRGIRVRRFVFEAPSASASVALRWPARAVATFHQLEAARREFRPDIVHVQCFGHNGVYAALLSTLRGVPLVVSLHGETFMDDNDIYAHSLFLRTGLRLGLRRATAVTGCSRFVLDDAIRFGLAPDRATVIFNGVDLDEVGPASPSQPFDRFVLGMGRLVERKGFDLLIDAWARIVDRHKNVGLVIGGIGPELRTLLDLVARRHLEERVYFAGLLSRADVVAMMRSAEIFVMPSRIEAFGIVALEAWRARTPLIVTANGGTAEFVDDGITGIVRDPRDADALARAIDLLLGDCDLRSRLAMNATKRLADFAWPAIGGLYENVYEAAMQKNASSPRVAGA